MEALTIVYRICDDGFADRVRSRVCHKFIHAARYDGIPAELE